MPSTGISSNRNSATSDATMSVQALESWNRQKEKKQRKTESRVEDPPQSDTWPETNSSRSWWQRSYLHGPQIRRTRRKETLPCFANHLNYSRDANERAKDEASNSGTGCGEPHGRVGKHWRVVAASAFLAF